MIVAVTGWGQAADRRRTAEAGFGHHLVKPVAADALHQLLALASHLPAGSRADATGSRFVPASAGRRRVVQSDDLVFDGQRLPSRR